MLSLSGNVWYNEKAIIWIYKKLKIWGNILAYLVTVATAIITVEISGIPPIIIFVAHHLSYSWWPVYKVVLSFPLFHRLGNLVSEEIHDLLKSHSLSVVQASLI